MGVADVTATDLCRLDLFVSADNFHLSGDRLAKNRLSFKLMQRLCSGILPFWSSFPPSGFDEWSIQYFIHSPVLLRSKVGLMVKKKKNWRVDIIFTTIIMARIVLMLCRVQRLTPRQF